MVTGGISVEQKTIPKMKSNPVARQFMMISSAESGIPKYYIEELRLVLQIMLI